MKFRLILVLIIIGLTIFLISGSSDVNVVFDWQGLVISLLILFIITFLLIFRIGGRGFEIFSLFFIFYFLQRIVLLNYEFEFFTFPRVVITAQDNNSALCLLLFFTLMIASGFELTGKKFNINKTNKFDLYIGNKRFINSWIFLSYNVLAMQYILLLFFNVGIGSIEPGQYAWIFRPLRAISVLSIGVLYIFIQNKVSISNSTKKSLSIFIALLLIFNILSGSRASILSLIISVLFIKILLGEDFVKKKYIYCSIVLIPILSLFFLFINEYRSYLQNFPSDNIFGFMSNTNFYDLVKNFNMLSSIEFLSLRMNGYDVFIASFVRSNELIPNMLISNHFLQIIDSLYPGSLFDGGPESAIAVVEILREVSIENYIFHREFINLIGMAYIYFGVIGGGIFLLTIFYIISYYLYSQDISIIIKLIILSSVLFYSFESGFLPSIFVNLSEQIIFYLIIIIIINFFNKFKWKSIGIKA